jgi:cbb3-type cytochrome oxidase maturation protein
MGRSAMNALLILIPVSLLLVALAVWAFFWAVDSGQFDDLDSPALEILRDDKNDPSGGPS